MMVRIFAIKADNKRRLQTHDLNARNGGAEASMMRGGGGGESRQADAHSFVVSVTSAIATRSELAMRRARAPLAFGSAAAR